MVTKIITSGLPGISVVIPTYNRELFLEESIRSVLDQEGKFHLEIIISDDGSTDKTMEIARSFGPKVKIVTKPEGSKKQGVAPTRNRGIEAATQPYICFLDSDDFYLPGHLDKMVSALEASPGLGFAFCRILEIREENSKRLFRPWSHEHIFKNDIRNPVVSRSHIVHTNSFIFRRKVFEEVGCFNESYSNGEDGDQWMRISEKFKGAFLEHFGVAYRTHHGAGQLTKNPSLQIKSCSLSIFENAKRRYYDLRLGDPNRIFKIEYNLLRFKYRNDDYPKTLYYRKYLGIILRYPLGYAQKLRESHFEKKEKPLKAKWDFLDRYLSSNLNDQPAGSAGK